MFCSKCGNQVRNDAVFCFMCGEKIIHSNSDVDKLEYKDNISYGDEKKSVIDKTTNKNIEHLIKNKKKINSIGIFTTIGLIIISFFLYNFFLDISIKKEYDIAYSEYLKEIGLDGYHVDDVYEDRFENVNNVYHYAIFKNKYENYYRLSSQFKKIINNYNKLQYACPSDYTLQEWESIKKELNEMSQTGDINLDTFVEVMKCECEAAEYFYNYDFKKAYEISEKYDNYIKNYIIEIRCYSATFEQIYFYSIYYDNNFIEDILKGNIVVDECCALCGDLTDEITGDIYNPVIYLKYDGRDEIGFVAYWNDNCYQISYRYYTTDKELANFNKLDFWDAVCYVDIIDVCESIKNETVTFCK